MDLRKMVAGKLGSGSRFKAVEASVSGTARDKAAVAASIGRKKYGNSAFQKLAAAGRRRAG